MAKHNNPYIKIAHQEHEYSLDHIKELQKCSTDPIYFIKTYCQIQHPKHGSVPFKLYPYQEEMISAYQNNRQVIILSSRQTGKCGTFTTKLIVSQIVDKHEYVLYNRFKRFVLKLLNRKIYDELFNSRL